MSTATKQTPVPPMKIVTADHVEPVLDANILLGNTVEDKPKVFVNTLSEPFEGSDGKMVRTFSEASADGTAIKTRIVPADFKMPEKSQAELAAEAAMKIYNERTKEEEDTPEKMSVKDKLVQQIRDNNDIFDFSEETLIDFRARKIPLSLSHILAKLKPLQIPIVEKKLCNANILILPPIVDEITPTGITKSDGVIKAEKEALANKPVMVVGISDHILCTEHFTTKFKVGDFIYPTNLQNITYYTIKDKLLNRDIFTGLIDYHQVGMVEGDTQTTHQNIAALRLKAIEDTINYSKDRVKAFVDHIPQLRELVDGVIHFEAPVKHK